MLQHSAFAMSSPTWWLSLSEPTNRWTTPQTNIRDQRHYGGKSQVLHRFNSEKQMGGDDWRAHHGGGTVTYLAECTRPRSQSLQKEFVRRRKSNAT